MSFGHEIFYTMPTPYHHPTAGPSCLWSSTDFVETTQAADVCVALVDARVMSDHQADSMRARLVELAEANGGKVVVSLANADGSSMSLFAALARVQDACMEHGGRMVLCNVPRGLGDALQRFGLRAKFTVVNDLAEGIDAARRPAKSGRAGWLSGMLHRRAA